MVSLVQTTSNASIVKKQTYHLIFLHCTNGGGPCGERDGVEADKDDSRNGSMNRCIAHQVKIQNLRVYITM